MHQRGVLCFRITDDNVVVRHQESIGDLTLGTEGFTGTRCAQDQAVRVFQKLPVHHDQVVGNGIQAIVQGFLSVLEKLLGRKRDHDAGRAAGHLPLDGDQVLSQRKAAHQGVLLLEIQPAQVAAVFLGDTGCLEIVGLQLLRRLPGIHHKEGDAEHTLILALQFLQEVLRVRSVSHQVARQDIHVIAGPDGFFLLLDLGTVQLCDRVLDLFDRLRLVYRLKMNRQDLRGLHIEEIFQQFIRQIRSRNGQVAHGTVDAAHLKAPAAGKGKGRRCDEILHRETGLRKPCPVKIEPVAFVQVEHVMHELQAFFPIQRFSPDAEPAKVVEKIILHMDEPGLCLPHAVRLNAEGQVFGLGQAVVALLQLGLQHLAVFAPDGIECVLLERDPDALFKAFGIGRHIQKGQFKVNGTVEEVEETAPFLKNGRLILVLRQLIIDVLIMNCLGVIVIRNPADAVREHPLERNRLLGRTRHPVVLPRPLDDLLYLLLLTLCEACRQTDFRRLSFCVFSGCSFVSSEQSGLPPFLPVPASPGSNSSYLSGKAGSSGG